jgi:hypothetical protein
MRDLGLAPADGAGVQIRKRHQPIWDYPVAGQPLVGPGQQPPGLSDRLLQLTNQPGKPPVIESAGSRQGTNAVGGA